MAIKFFVISFVVLVACLGMLVAAIDAPPHRFHDRHHHEHGANDSPSGLTRLLSKLCPYSKRQTVDMLLALLLLAAAVAFLASDTMDAVCDVESSSAVEQAKDAAESAIDSLGLGDDDSSSGSSGSSDTDDGSSSFGCTVLKTTVGCALGGALLFLVTLALTCPPFSRRPETLEDGERATEAESNKPSTEELEQRESDYHRLEGASPRAESTPTDAERRL